MALFATQPDQKPPPSEKPEIDRFDRLREKVRRGLQSPFVAGDALAEIKNHNLFASKYDSWEECLLAEWQLGPRQASRLIRGAALFRLLCPIGHHPTHETQLRPLHGVQDEFAKLVWQRAIELGDTTEQGVRAALLALKPRKPKKVPVKRAKPIVFRGEGWRVTIEPTRKGLELNPADVLAIVMDQIVEQQRESRQRAAA